MTAGSNTNAALIAYNRKWVQLHRANRYQAEAAKRMTEVLDALAEAEQRAEEAERLAEVRLETIREYGRENEAWSVRAHTAERERDRLDEAFDRDLPWRYDEVEAQRNRLAAVVEKVREAMRGPWPYADETYRKVTTVVDTLATTPADALREVKAAAWDEGFSHCFDSVYADGGASLLDNPYRARGEQS